MKGLNTGARQCSWLIVWVGVVLRRTAVVTDVWTICVEVKTLKMTSTQLVEMSVTTNSLSQNYTNQDYQPPQTEDLFSTFKTFPLWPKLLEYEDNKLSLDVREKEITILLIHIIIIWTM